MNAEIPQLKSDTTALATSWEAQIGSVRVLFGPDRMQEAGDEVLALGGRRVLVVSDPGLEAAGHLQTLQTTLANAELEVATFCQVSENPSSEQVREGAVFASTIAPDCILALGGGSAMDCAKGINFLHTNGGRMADYWGYGRVTRPLLPALGIPTTAGTGSEAQSFALISDSSSHRKMACGDDSARFRAVILDPSLLSSVPARIAAATGLDAVSHALESHVSTRSNPISRLYSRHAWELLNRALAPSLTEDADLETSGRVLLAAHLAGAAIEQSMLGAAHACANPLTAVFGITHGQAVALMLPHVVRFNAAAAADEYCELAQVADLESSSSPAEAIACRIEDLRRSAGLPQRLQDLGVPRTELPTLAKAAALEWTARFNPRPVDQEELESLYAAAY